MIQFSKLRIQGFKSFVERTELDIHPGLNGIVGPNGCGKSNLVEALRWVMGENSPKRMRGDGMEDVIFNGTEQRPARNLAEVSLLLDNSKRAAPSAYNGSSEIEVTRRIERDHGSTYKINGKTVRARDVQMLFADTVTGANSPALVSQGRVTQIINAKPSERRLILEESAGISGLFVRRHEAELRLRAADANLLRMDDILAGMDSRLQDLKRQARQASRYRNVSAQIRQMEILIAWLEWKALDEKTSETRTAFAQAESLAADHLTTVTQLTKTQNKQAEDLPGLRQAEAEAAAALQARKIESQRLDDEMARHEAALHETSAQHAQTESDKTHEEHVLSESADLAEKLDAENKTILAEQDEAGRIFETKRQTRDAMSSEVSALEARYNALLQISADAKAQRSALESHIAQSASRAQTLTARRDAAQAELEKIAQSADLSRETDMLKADISQHEKILAEQRAEAEASRARQAEQSSAMREAQDALSKTELRQAEIASEIGVLEAFFAEQQDGAFNPVLNEILASEGFEKALSRALGDALLASLDDDAPARWTSRQSLPDLPALPEGVTALLPRIKAPEALHAALSQIGVVEAEQHGHEAVQRLAAGQSLVSTDGFYWRWDGLFIKPEAADRNALHLEYKNRLSDFRARLPAFEEKVAAAREALRETQQNYEAHEAALKDLQAGIAAADNHVSLERARLAGLLERQMRSESERARLQDVLESAASDLEAVGAAITADKKRLEAYEGDAQADNERKLEDLRIQLHEARVSHQGAARAYDLHEQEQSTRSARLRAIADERVNIQNRIIRSRERVKQLGGRLETLSARLEDLKNQPKNFEAERERILGALSACEHARGKAAEILAVRENEVAESGRALKEAEARLAETRERRAGMQSLMAALVEQHESLKAAIHEKFAVAPEELQAHAAIDPEKTPGTIDELRGKKEKYIRERDQIGAVNLRADEESQSLEQEVSALLSERGDLMQAVEELRGGIAKINKEARERLLLAFDQVNAHFKTLFGTLFGGGEAHLALIDSDDPLGAGLEIFAQPPGKTLQSLSLLSGGEQTLASIALIFSMFLTNPSPICVLDEIDAPLDDANVDRVCDLLDHIAGRGETRFLIITHHRLTMARMDRLYGVTMAERGVSQLVSVDLQKTFEFMEAA